MQISMPSILVKNIYDDKTKTAQKQTDFLKASVESIEKQTAVLKEIGGDRRFKISNNELNAKVGDTFDFEVVGKSKNDFTLKLLENNIREAGNLIAKQISHEELADMLKKHNIIASEENMLTVNSQKKMVQEQKLIAEAKAKINRELSYASGNVTQSAINELLSSGLSLDKISLGILNNVMRHIELKPPQQLSEKELNEVVSQISEKEIEGKAEIIKALHKNNLPINDRNVKLLEGVAAKAESLKTINDSQITGLVKSEKPITLENIYISRHTSAIGQPEQALPNETWLALQPEIEKSFKREHIDFNEKNLSYARMMIEKDVLITKGNIEKVDFLKNISSHINAENVLDMAAKNIKNNTSPASIDFLNEKEAMMQKISLLKNYKGIINDLPLIKPEKVEVLLKNQIPLTLNNLRTQFTKESPDVRIIDPIYAADDNELAQTILSGKRQLAEIQLKLTKDAAVRLAGKNINIETMHLEDALEELRNIEKTPYVRHLKIMDAPLTKENVDNLSGLFAKMGGFKNITNNAYGNILLDKTKFNIDGIDNSIKLAKTIKDLEQFATAPNPKYGDSFRNVRNQISPLLQTLGIEANDSNVRAASILSRNNLDFNPENVVKINTIDAKINRIQDTLHPNIAANMLKDGLDPSEMHIDDVLSYIEKFNGQYGENLKDKISRYIMEMDDNKSIDKTTREGMIAIYRMLNAVQKNESISIGVTVKNGVDLTLGNLMEAADYYGKTSGKYSEIDIRLDQTTGELEALNIPESNIKGVLTKTAMEYNKTRIDSFIEAASPDKLGEIIRHEGVENVKTKALSELINELKAMTSTQLNNTAIKANDLIQQLTESSSEMLHWMSTNNIPLTFNNISCAKKLSTNQFFITDEINDIQSESDLGMEEVADKPSLDKFKKGINTTASLSSEIEKIKDGMTDRVSIERLTALQNVIKFQTEILEKQDKQHIPVSLTNRIAGLNMYVINENLEKVENKRIYMSLNTENLGNIQILINAGNNKTGIKITSDDEHGLSVLKQSCDELDKALKHLPGVNLEFELEQQKNFVTEVNDTALPIQKSIKAGYSYDITA